MKKNKTYLKKTYLGPKRRVWHHLGPFSSSRTLLVMSEGLRWPSLAVVGCCGPSWACVGLPWAAVGPRGVLWAFVGLRWRSVACCGPALAFVGRRWLLWAFVGFRGGVGTCWGRRNPPTSHNDSLVVVGGR